MLLGLRGGSYDVLNEWFEVFFVKMLWGIVLGFVMEKMVWVSSGKEGIKSVFLLFLVIILV